MTTMEQQLDVMRAEIIRDLFTVHTPETLRSISRTIKRALKREEAEAEDDTEYISKQEVMDGIRRGLTEFYRSQRTGQPLRNAEELINEL